MKSFADPYTSLLTKILDFLPRNPSLSIEYKIDPLHYFELKVSSFFEQHPFYNHKTFGESLPIHQVRFSLCKEGIPVGSSGTDYDKDTAILISQAELLERISSWVPLDYAKKNNFKISALQEGGSKKLYVKSILGFRYEKVSAYNIYWGLAKHRGTKRHITTSGIAGHFNKDEATLNAWMELIERDAFLMYWLNTISPKHIDITASLKVNQKLKLLIEGIQAYGYEYFILDISSDIEVPVCLAIVTYSTPRGRKMVLGAKAHFDAETAIVGALTEAIVLLESVIEFEPFNLPSNFSSFADERVNQSARVRLFLSEEGFSRASFLIKSNERITVKSFETVGENIESMQSSSVKEKNKYLKFIFKKRYKNNKNYDVLSYSFNNKLIKIFNFHVVRVICEALYPIYLSEHFGDPEHPRLKEFVTNKGLEHIAKLNTYPHPFS